jgi:TRAP-type C4-dicarboxylate transport system substrate-binding protein
MNNRRVVFFALWIFLTGLKGEAVMIKIGSAAPSRSPWDKALVEIGIAWEKISNGAVKVRIYPGGIAGNEADMIRKMRLDVLQGAVLTNMGIDKIEKSVFVLTTPFLFSTQEEFDYVFEKMKPIFENKIEAKGFKMVLWTLAGWVHFFAKEAVLYPEDLKKHKISFSQEEPEMEQAWKKMGYYVIPGDLKDLMVSLQSGMVSATYLPVLVAGSGQYFAIIRHMLSLRLSPLVGGLLLSEKTWRSIPEQYREPLISAAEKAAVNLYQTTMELEKEALKAMIENGLIIHEPPADALQKWREASDRGMDELIGKAFSKEVFDQTLSYIREYWAKIGR